MLVGLNHEIKVYLQGEEQTLQYYGHANIELHPGASIAAVRLNTRSEDVVVKTTRNEFHVWRNEPLTLSNQEKSRANFVKMDSPPWDPSEGTVSISTGQKYCLLVGGNIVTLWNVESNDCVLTCSFTGDQQMADSKCILSSAIHPDGNSLLLAFEDRIRLYKILLTKFKLSFEFPIRRCQNIVYSHDGHLAACRYGRGSNSSVVILNLLRLTEMCVIKLQAEPLQMLWNTLDDELIISTENHCVQAYKAADNSRLYLLRLAHRINFIRID